MSTATARAYQSYFAGRFMLYGTRKIPQNRAFYGCFGSRQNYPDIEKLLLCDTQKDENCKYIILVSRLNDLLIGKYDELFLDYYAADAGFAQTVADTGHYYTHYGKSKEKKALKGDKLIDAIGILSLLLEYNICLQLEINNQAKVRERLSSIEPWKQFQNYYQKEIEQKKY